MSNFSFEEALSEALQGGPATGETLVRRLAAVDPRLTARGPRWLEAELQRSTLVHTLPDGRFQLSPGRDEELEFEQEELDVSPPIPEVDRSVSERYIVFDLEANADRADPAEHEIVEFGAVLVVAGKVADEFHSLARPSRPLTRETARLTGITEAELNSAPELGSALDRFLEFVADTALVAHNGIGYDFRLLDATCLRAEAPMPTGTRLDSLELAHIVFPRTGETVLPNVDGSMPPAGRSLQTLGAYLDLEGREVAHRAVEDARLTHQLLRWMLEELEADSPVRRLQLDLLQSGGSPWAGFFERAKGAPSLEEIVPFPAAWEPREPTGMFDPKAAVDPLRAGGAVIDGEKQPRRQQVEMATLVGSAFGNRQQHVIEAPTGTGKTLAYLVPAVAFARASGRPVAVATFSKVLQNQVLTTFADVGQVFEDVRVVVLKGRDNYLSLDALEDAVESPPSDPEEALALALLVGWAALTPTGDWDDLRVWAIEQRETSPLPVLKWRLRVDRPLGIARTKLEERDFYRRAIQNLDRADVVVLNHALLVSQNDWAEGSKHLVVDEAHNLEEAATSAFTEEVTEALVDRILASVYDPRRRRGTLTRYARATYTPRTAPQVKNLVKALKGAREAASSLGSVLITHVRGRSGARKEQVERFGASYRLRRGFDTRAIEYQPILRATEKLRRFLYEVATALGNLTIPDRVKRPYRRHRLEAEISRLAREARTTADLLGKIPRCEDENAWIYIADLTILDGQWRWGLRRAPLTVGPELSNIWRELEGLVITSATLRVAGEFDHIIERLGLSQAQTRALDTPFTHIPESELLVLPDHLPMPRGGLMDEFTRAEADEVARLLTLTTGRGLVLFTSKARLQWVRDFVRPLLEDQQQIPILAQGEEPAPALAERMRTDLAASLLATRSFWEGIDIPGENLSLLVIEKVPFDPPGDPIVAARMDALEVRGRDPFSDYLVPRAVLRFVQGVGRLIRTSEDRGVVVLLDKRLRKPVAYRDRFLTSLVGPPRISRPLSADEAYEEIAGHLGFDIDAALWERIHALPTSDPWGDVEELVIADDEVADDELVLARLQVMRERFGFADWREQQVEVMLRFIRGEDVLAVLPTGSGKSVAYQIPALLRPGLTLVISPLVALMRDQIQQLRERGIVKINGIYSGQSQLEQEEILARARSGAYKLLYVSPERLWSQRFREALRDVKIARVAVDEAHCVSQWGHNFRPEYSLISRALAGIAEEQGRPPVLAATATATEQVQEEIQELLELRISSSPVTRSPDRPELRYYVEDVVNRQERDLRVVEIAEAYRGQSVIVYVPRRDDTLRIAGLLRAANHIAQPYHGGMEPPQRIHTEEAFRDGEVDMVVATKAFGLGIDKPDVAAVVHLEMPATVEEYIQETGRAARGAVEGVGPETGACILLRMPRDCGIHGQFVKGAAPSLDVVKRVWDELQQSDNYALPEELAERIGLSSGATEGVALAVHYLMADGAVERLEDVTWAGQVWIPREVEALLEQEEERDPEVASWGRSIVALANRRGTEFSITSWSEALDVRPEELERRLLEVFRRDIVGFTAWKIAWHIRRVPGREPDWGAIGDRCDERKMIVSSLSKKSKEFKSQDAICRRAWMLSYLGVDAPGRCEACDVCISDLPRPWEAFELKQEDIADAVPAKAVCLALLYDVEHLRYSRQNVARALAGLEGRQYKLPPVLKNHPNYGRLAVLELEGVESELARLVAEGLAEAYEATFDDRTYAALKLTEEGRRRA